MGSEQDTRKALETDNRRLLDSVEELERESSMVGGLAKLRLSQVELVAMALWVGSTGVGVHEWQSSCKDKRFYRSRARAFLRALRGQR